MINHVRVAAVCDTHQILSEEADPQLSSFFSVMCITDILKPATTRGKIFSEFTHLG